jgi:hypothetical protein
MLGKSFVSATFALGVIFMAGQGHATDYSDNQPLFTHQQASTIQTTQGAQQPLTNEEIDRRIQVTNELLKSQERSADYWEYGWGAFNTGTMIWSAEKASVESNHRNRATDIVQASESLVGLANVVFRPLPAFVNSSECTQPPPDAQGSAKCLEANETLLERSAERAQEPYTLLPHVGNVAFNAIAGLIVWKVGSPHNALFTAVPGIAIGEAQIWTTPSGPMGDFNRYKIKFSPLVEQSENSKDTTAGLRLSMNF